MLPNAKHREGSVESHLLCLTCQRLHPHGVRSSVFAYREYTIAMVRSPICATSAHTTGTFCNGAIKDFECSYSWHEDVYSNASAVLYQEPALGLAAKITVPAACMCQHSRTNSAECFFVAVLCACQVDKDGRSTMRASDFVQRRFLLAVFVVSGFTGLIYESIWSHYLKLFLGHAAYAQTLVLAIFMGGMALGSWAVAHYSGRLRHLLWSYVLVEGLIGLLGVIFHRTFVVASDFSFASVIPSLPAGFLIHAYKWSLAALLIFPQSVLLGMTFPLISGGLIRRWPDRPGETLATLYFTNSLGAAIGVLVSGFVLIRAVGLPGTILTAGLLNVALALLVWSIVRRQTEPAPTPQTAPASPSTPDTLARWFVIAAFLTGAASFMYELGWIRMLSLVLSSSTHSFELMLSAFIFGLAFGGLYVRRRIARIADPATYAGWSHGRHGRLGRAELAGLQRDF